MQSKYIRSTKGINKLHKALDQTLEQAVQFIVTKIHENTPRDLKRPPKDLSAHVTWTLKSSIGYQRKEELNYKVWSRQWTKNNKSWEYAETYWERLEFWTKYMKSRSFIRKGVRENLAKIKSIFAWLARRNLK